MIQCGDCGAFFFLKESIDAHPYIGYVPMDDAIRQTLEWRQEHQ
jgi:hypothetical protein